MVIVRLWAILLSMLSAVAIIMAWEVTCVAIRFVCAESVREIEGTMNSVLRYISGTIPAVTVMMMSIIRCMLIPEESIHTNSLRFRNEMRVNVDANTMIIGRIRLRIRGISLA